MFCKGSGKIQSGLCWSVLGLAEFWAFSGLFQGFMQSGEILSCMCVDCVYWEYFSFVDLLLLNTNWNGMNGSSGWCCGAGPRRHSSHCHGRPPCGGRFHVSNTDTQHLKRHPPKLQVAKKRSRVLNPYNSNIRSHTPFWSLDPFIIRMSCCVPLHTAHTPSKTDMEPENDPPVRRGDSIIFQVPCQFSGVYMLFWSSCQGPFFFVSCFHWSVRLLDGSHRTLRRGGAHTLSWAFGTDARGRKEGGGAWCPNWWEIWSFRSFQMLSRLNFTNLTRSLRRRKGYDMIKLSWWS